MFRIIGADGREYGPVAAELLQQWVAEGRAHGQTPAQSEGTGWKPLSAFPEFAHLAGPPTPQATPPVFADRSPERNNPMAVTGFICSLLGLTCCGPFLLLLGVIFSIVGLSEIKREPGRFTGRSLAIAGIIIGLAGLALFALILAGSLVGNLWPFGRHFHRIML